MFGSSLNLRSNPKSANNSFFIGTIRFTPWNGFGNSNSGCNLLREVRTKAQKSYLAGVVYSKYRVDLSRYPGPDRYNNAHQSLVAQGLSNQGWISNIRGL